jgi:hypothetical protein
VQELRAYAESLEKIIEWMKSPDYAPGKTPPIVARRPADMTEGAGAGAAADGDAAAASPSRPASGTVSLGDGDGDAAAAVGGAGALSERLVELDMARAAAENRAESLQSELTTVRLPSLPSIPALALV